MCELQYQPLSANWKTSGLSATPGEVKVRSIMRENRVETQSRFFKNDDQRKDSGGR